MSNELKRIDEEQFDELRALLAEDFDDLIRTFINDSQLRMDEIRQALEVDNNRLGYEAVHAMKGACINLGANLLSDLCFKLQMQCKDKQITSSHALIDHIDEERKMLIDELNRRLG